jgi:hypothetical protein
LAHLKKEVRNMGHLIMSVKERERIKASERVSSGELTLKGGGRSHRNQLQTDEEDE